MEVINCIRKLTVLGVEMKFEQLLKENWLEFFGEHIAHATREGRDLGFVHQFFQAPGMVPGTMGLI